MISFLTPKYFMIVTVITLKVTIIVFDNIDDHNYNSNRRGPTTGVVGGMYRNRQRFTVFPKDAPEVFLKNTQIQFLLARVGLLVFEPLGAQFFYNEQF